MPIPAGYTQETVISNGSSNPITAVDWNMEQANQKVVSDMRDSTYKSPLETVFLTQTTRPATAVEVYRELDPVKMNPVLIFGLGLLILKLIRR